MTTESGPSATCNYCLQHVTAHSQFLVAQCGHGFCMDCTARICDSGNACPSCGTPLDANNVSIAVVGEGTSPNALDGMSAPAILQVVQNALDIQRTQRELAYKASSAATKKRYKHIMESSKQKMTNIHAAYVNAVSKSKEHAAKAPKEDADVEELRSKAVEHSRICRKLQAQLSSLTPQQPLDVSPQLDMGLMASPYGAQQRTANPMLSHRPESGHWQPLPSNNQLSNHHVAGSGGKQRARLSNMPSTPSDLAVTELSAPSSSVLSGLAERARGSGGQAAQKSGGSHSRGPGKLRSRGSLSELLKAKYSGK